MTDLEKFVDAFSSALGIDKKNVVDDLKYQSIPEWDSLKQVILISELEDAFSISIEMEDLIELKSVANAKEILKKYGIII